MNAAEREELLREAEKLVLRGRIEGAIIQYRKVLKEVPNDTTLLNLVGDLYARVNRTPEAIDQYERLSERFATEGFFVKAVAVLKKVQRLDASRFDLYERLGDLYRRQGLLKEAVGQYLSLADHYHRREQKAEAVAVYRRLIEIEPQGLEHRLRVAQLYEELGQLDRVASEYRDIARFMLAHDRVDEATKVLQIGLQVDPTNETYIREALSLLRQSGRSDIAADLLEEAESLNPALGDLSLSEEDPEDESAASAVVDFGAGASDDLSLGETEGAPAAGADGIGGATGAGVSARRPASEADELLAEAQVFVKCGLEQKALDRLEEVLQIAPRNLSAHGQLISLLLEQQSYDRVKACAQRMALTARERGDLLPWRDMRQKLLDAGFGLDGDEVVTTPADPQAATEGEAEPEAVGPSPESSDPLAALLDNDASDFGALIATDSPDSMELVGSIPEIESVAAAAPQNERVSEERGQVVVVGADPLPGQVSAANGGEAEVESVRDIVDHFTQGVGEHLSDEDSDTHYNLGIAFREMGLLKEAIGEFETAALSAELKLSCYSLLSECLRETGEVDRAIRWCQTGLAEPGINEEQQLAFLYEIAACQASGGDAKSAYETFAQIHGLEPEYRDVVARLAELGD